MFTKTLLPDTLRAIQLISGISEDHLYSILRSLDYFEDAEKESEMPKMLIGVNWEEVKNYFRKETQKLIKNKLQT